MVSPNLGVFSMLAKFYLGLAGLALGWYLFTTFTGREFGTRKLSSAPPSSSASSGRSGGGGFFFGGGGGYGGGK
jgi:hypothetical protein